MKKIRPNQRQLITESSQVKKCYLNILMRFTSISPAIYRQERLIVKEFTLTLRVPFRYKFKKVHAIHQENDDKLNQKHILSSGIITTSATVCSRFLNLNKISQTQTWTDRNTGQTHGLKNSYLRRRCSHTVSTPHPYTHWTNASRQSKSIQNLTPKCQ